MGIRIQKTVNRSMRVGLRLSPNEHDRIQDFCKKNSVSFSDFVRQCIKQADHKLIEEDLKERK